MRRVPIGLVGFRVLVVAFGLVLLAAQLIATSRSARAAVGDITEYHIPTANSNAEDIVAGSDGNLWFTEFAVNSVARVTTSGVITEYSVPATASGPAGIAAGPDGNLWFTELNTNQVARVTTSGAFSQFPVPTAGSQPNGIVAGPDGNLWVTEHNASKVAKVTTSGAITEYPLPTAGDPSGIAAGPDGNLWITEYSTQIVAKVTISGAVTEYHVPSSPVKIAAGPDGNLWFTEPNTNKVAKITTSGTVTEYMTPGAGSSGPSGIAAGPDGNVWFTELNGNKVASVTPGGVFNEYSIFTPNTGPSGIALGPDGNLWFTEQAANQVAKVVAALATPPGVLGTFRPMSPLRVLDTRTNGQPLGEGSSLNVQLGGSSVPANATAVVANVTVTNTTAPGFLTIYPEGSPRPLASNLNWTGGETVPNLVHVALGATGQVTIYNSAGSTDVLMDLQGYFAPSTGSTAGEFVPLPPSRITDTRFGSGWPHAGSTLGEGATLDVQVAGFFGNVPATGVEAVVLNATVTNTTAPGFLTAYPKGSSLPVASNLNWLPDTTVPNRLVVPVGAGGMVTFFNSSGSTDLVLDVNGYFTDSTASGASFAPLTPSRILDTRDGNGGFNSPVPQGTGISVVVAGQGGVPQMTAARPPTAVVLNVTATNPTAAGFLTVFPDIAPIPEASDLNFVAGQTVPNLVVVKIGTDGRVDVYNAWGSTDVVFDLVGWYG